MTAYSNFIQDFPNRCIEILNTTYQQTITDDREVTLMLAIAAAAFIIPFERLRSLPEGHPADDVNRYPKATRKYNKATNSNFIRSHRWGQGKTWEFIEGVDGNEIRKTQVDGWACKENRSPLSEKKLTNSVFSHLRNALAHGSIFTYPNSSANGELPQIDVILFVSRCYEKQEIERCGVLVKENVPLDKYDVLIVSPQEFLSFLKKWVEFLNSLDLGDAIIQSTNFELPETSDDIVQE